MDENRTYQNKKYIQKLQPALLQLLTRSNSFYFKYHSKQIQPETFLNRKGTFPPPLLIKIKEEKQKKEWR